MNESNFGIHISKSYLARISIQKFIEKMQYVIKIHILNNLDIHIYIYTYINRSFHERRHYESYK